MSECIYIRTLEKEGICKPAANKKTTKKTPNIAKGTGD